MSNNNNPLIGKGMANVAFEAYVIACRRAGIDIDARADKRVVQAIGNAKASAGYHHADGMLDGHQYTAAVDLSVRDLNRTRTATWIEELCEVGFVAFGRLGGTWTGNEHIHANYCGLPMKSQLDGQNEDFFKGLDGLVGHRSIAGAWWYPEKEARKIPEAMFRKSNPRGGKAGIVVRSPALAAPAPIEAVTNALYLPGDKTPRFQMPVIAGVTYAPLRKLGEALKFNVGYDEKTGRVEYNGDDLAVSIKWIGGETFAPIRLVASEIDYTVDDSKLADHKLVIRR